MKPVIASSFGPSGEATSRSAWATNQVATTAGEGHRRAGDHRAPRGGAFAPSEAGGHGGEDQHGLEPLAEDDRRRVEDDRGVALRAAASVGSTGPVFAVAIR